MQHMNVIKSFGSLADGDGKIAYDERREYDKNHLEELLVFLCHLAWSDVCEGAGSPGTVPPSTTSAEHRHYMRQSGVDSRGDSLLPVLLLLWGGVVGMICRHWGGTT